MGMYALMACKNPALFRELLQWPLTLQGLWKRHKLYWPFNLVYVCHANTENFHYSNNFAFIIKEHFAFLYTYVCAVCCADQTLYSLIIW
jgi:hypothetical protein